MQPIERTSLAGAWQFRTAGDDIGDGNAGDEGDAAGDGVGDTGGECDAAGDDIGEGNAGGEGDAAGDAAADRWHAGEVPGDVYLDLLRAGEIPDPFVGDAELDVQWVGETDWIYRRTISVDAERLEHEAHRLVFRGLDTVAEVFVNGERVGRSDNMHRRYAFDVGDALVPGENDLRVEFASPVEYARERAAAYPDDLPATHYPVEQPHRNQLRKAQCHFGWDWGICLPTVGIWCEVELVSFSEPRITDVAVGQEHLASTGDCDADRTATLEVDVRVESPVAGDYDVALGVADVEETATVGIAAGVDECTVELEVDDPELWWPAGHGDQPLYDLTVTLVSEGGAAVDEAVERIGFREIELVRETDEHGESFRFEVNGRPIFAKGANWIPADGIHSRVDESDYRRLLEDAVAANMNAIRVWGGGIYEREAFYDACDELGLLVWQDFAFACALYPTDDAFLETVAAEARYQVRRLASRPSIALWCGNNETDYLFDLLVDPEQERSDRLRADYDELFRETLGPIVDATDPDDRAYWQSSPSSSSPDLAPNDESEGDVHYWDVWHDREPFSAYLDVEPRFASEFGYQSFPSTATLATVLDEEQLNPTAPLMEYHQRDPGGNGRILERATDHFRVPWSFEHFVYLSQLQQAMAMQTAIEHWRRLQPRCAGTLYWQLNDMWPVASWSSIEYGGRWKALQHVARRFFAPVLVSTVHVDADGNPVGLADDDAERVQVWVTADGPEAPEGDVELSVETFDGAVLEERRVDAEVGVRGSEIVATVDPATIDWGPSDVLLRAEYTGAEESYPAFETLVPYKRLDLPDVDLDVTVDGDTVTVTAERAALYVALDPGELAGHFSDNYFHLAAGEERTVTFQRRADEDGALADALGVTHLRETY